MITYWEYCNIGGHRQKIKSLLGVDTTINCIDIGASADHWSYPECKSVLDISDPPDREGVIFFKLNFNDQSSWDELIKTTEEHGKFDYSICSHTLEDISNPDRLLKNITKLSKRGFIAIPSKFNEFRKLYNNGYRGNAHHKQFFDIKDNKLTLYPKYSWIEVDERSDKLLENGKGDELVLYWENDIDMEFFNNDEPFISDDQLITQFYQELMNNE